MPSHLESAGGLDEGLAALKRLRHAIADKGLFPNEADTRFQIIDSIIVECLGYSRSEVSCEPSTNIGYADYFIGDPVRMVWEAKRNSTVFEIPANKFKRSIQSLSSIASVSKAGQDTIEQVNNYARDKGIPLCVICNGEQIIAFRTYSGVGKPTGNAYILKSLEDFEENFGRAWQLLSQPALAEGRMLDFLDRSSAVSYPEKLSTYIPNYPQVRERTDLQASLNTIADLLLLNIEKQSDLEEAFYRNCYVESGGLGQNATISKSILAARYSSLFAGESKAIEAQPVKASAKKDNFTPALLAEAISNKPIVLVGDVGVGKSSFIRHLNLVSAHSEFRHAIYIYVDLSIKGALQLSVRDLVLNQIEAQLEERYGIDVEENDFVSKVYQKRLARFKKSPKGRLSEVSPEAYLAAEIEFLSDLMGDRSEHMKNCVSYLAKDKKKQIIIALDNADKRSSEVQNETFIIGQSLASEWSAAVFVTMRPSTFYTSKKSGVLSAYQNRVFTIPPPRIDLVLEKRLKFALDIAEGKRELEQIRHIELNLPSVVAILNSVIPSIMKMTETQVFLENFTAGNVRDVIEFVAEVIGSPNIDTESAIRGIAQGDEFIIPTHDFWKVALKGEYNYFDPSRVRADNIYRVFSNDRSEHFLASLMLSFLHYDGAKRSSEGFVRTRDLLSEVQNLGFSITSAETCLRTLVNDKLCETSLRITFDEDELGLFGTLPEFLRVNTKGAYYLDRWMATMPYLDAVAPDMSIFDHELRENLIEDLRSLSLESRLRRAMSIRDYLSDVWQSLAISVPYFDWQGKCTSQNLSFEKVDYAVAKRRKSD